MSIPLSHVVNIYYPLGDFIENKDGSHVPRLLSYFPVLSVFIGVGNIGLSIQTVWNKVILNKNHIVTEEYFNKRKICDRSFSERPYIRAVHLERKTRALILALSIGVLARGIIQTIGCGFLFFPADYITNKIIIRKNINNERVIYYEEGLPKHTKNA